MTSCAMSPMNRAMMMGMMGQGMDRGAPFDSAAFMGDLNGFNTDAISDFSDIIDDIKDKKVVYVGEQHDDYGHHRVQLEVIRSLYDRGVKISVGMEMFQRPFQPVIDSYMKGEISEREFLKDSEYFDRWSYNYGFYRPIIQFCKENFIPLVALNMKKEISRKVAKVGIDGLSPEEKELLPDEIDRSNSIYEARLNEIYAMHARGAVDGFNNFFSSQLIWDETMSETAYKFLKDNPERHMVVLAGVGHIMYGDGIPDRVARRGGWDQSLIINAGSIDISDNDIGDYILFPEKIKEPFSYKAGVALKALESGGLLVEKIFDGTPAETAEMKKGDVVLTVNGNTMKTVGDFRIETALKNTDESLTLEIVRKKFLFGAKTIQVTLK